MAIKEKWLISVPVATVWTSPHSAREIDKLAITNPADVDMWLRGLTYENSLDFCNNNLIQSQVLFGEEVLVLEEKDGWVHVVVPSQSTSKDKRGYPGWLPKVQIVQSESWPMNECPVVVLKQPKTTLYDDSKQAQLLLSYQTILPFISRDEEWIQVQTPTGDGYFKVEEVNVYDSVESIPKRSGINIVSAGKQFLGLPYLWGGTSSFGYDCSGFTYSMCKANGNLIPRDAHDQASEGVEVPLAHMKPGDLLFFAYEEGKGSIHHVGIYYGEGKLLHSPNTGKSIEIIELQNTIYEKELCAARRYWQETEE